MTELSVLLDASALYSPEPLCEIARTGKVTFFGSILTVIETASDLVDERSRGRARSQMRLFRELIGDRLLPDPENLFRRYLGLPEHIEEPLWWCYIDLMAGNGDLEQITTRQMCGDLGTPLAIDVACFEQWRAEHGAQFVQGVEEMVKCCNPRADASRERWAAQIPADDKPFAEQFVATQEFADAVTSVLLSRAGLEEPVAPLTMGKARMASSGFAKMYGGYLLKTLCHGRKPEANDYNDIHQTLCLWQDRWAVCSNDTKSQEWALLGGLTKQQFITVKELEKLLR